jgi:ubiquinone/menaquinone biosynthesis C-methylase UbiE
MPEAMMALGMHTDRDWEEWGKVDPYFAVLTSTKYLKENLNDDALQEFFASGEQHIDHIYKSIREHIKPSFQPAHVLDYGCGVGRLVVAMAERAQTVVGVDVSPSMLEQAKHNCMKLLGASNTRLMHVDEMGSLEPASFDLVHSLFVFQHIPVARGELILRKLIGLIAEGGMGAIHLTYCDSRSALRNRLKELLAQLPLVNNLAKLARRRPFSKPRMEMNSYSMNRIFEILVETHCSNLHIEFLNHAGIHGTLLYFEKSSKVGVSTQVASQ